MPAEKPLRFTFHYSERLHLQKDFQRVFTSGRRLAHPALFIYIFPRPEGTGVCRLGLVTSRKVGKAVDRNRLKRRLRELFRLNKHLLTPGLDILFVLKSPATTLNYTQLETIVTTLLRQGDAFK
jgi:ribonuclease P protein component